MGKDERKSDLTLKPEAELTDFERRQLALLQVGPEYDFNVVIERTMAFYNSDGWKEKRRDKVKSERDKKQTYEIVWEQMPSSGSTKTAVKFTVNLPDLKAGALAKVLGDDPQRTDSRTGNMYKYDTMLESNAVDHVFANNVVLNHTTHKAPFFGVGPREMQGYLSYLNSFTPEQQAKLKIVPKKEVAAGKEGAATDKSKLHVVAQCMIDFTHFNTEHGIDEEAKGQAQPPKKKSVLGSSFYYLVMAQEELDGSLTLTLVIDMDPAGSLPTKVVDMALSEQLNKMKLMAQLCEKAGVVEDYVKPYENTRDFFPL